MTEQQPQKQRLTLYFDPELVERLKQLAKKDRRTVSAFVELLIVEALKEDVNSDIK